ncbi:C-terminal domain of homeodomain 1-domain-containing protein [Boletus edulis]|nr:C-terminal domain of homeodomain 1-domain-containing protein [Boletus edulis]
MLSGDGELAPYDFSWTSLLDEVSQASALGDISNATISVADDVVARVSALVECCLSLSSVPPPSFPVLNRSKSSTSRFHTNTSFIPEAYSWLLENIANPYPSSEFRASLAQRYNYPVSAVSSWFANVRRRMGWTALCRDFFRNRRADAVDAAYHVLVEEDSNYQLGPEVIHAFVAMKVAAEGLYASFEKSALAGDLDTVMKDMLTGDKMLERDGRRGETEELVRSKEPEEYTRKQSTCAPDALPKNLTPTCYFSPDLSRIPGPDGSPTDESEGGLLVAGHNLRSLPLRPAQSPSSSAIARSVEPPGFSSPLDDFLPSSTSTEEPLENDSCDQTPHVSGTENTVNINSHKRRLSDPHTIGVPKRPRPSMAGPPLQSVSDQLPLSILESEYSIDEWFNTNFDALFALPPPVDVAKPDHSIRWEVELFNNYSIPEDPQEAPNPPTQDNQILSATDLTTLEDLLQSLESGGFFAPPDIARPPTMALVPDPVPQGLLFPDLSQTINWTALLNEDPSEGPTCGPVFPRSYVDSSLPEIDSILQLPQVWTTVAS